jgi:hypothetical protein
LEIGANFNYYYLHDFDLDSTWRILDINFPSPFYISAGQGNLNDNKEENYDIYYSLTPDDSLLFLGAFFNYTDSTWLSGYPEMYGRSESWPRSFSSDTTMIYYSNEELTQLSQYHIYSQRIDTLVITDSNQVIISFAYNKKMNILAYAINPDWRPELHLLYVNSGKDTVVFKNSDIQFLRATDYLKLAWNEEDSTLAFWGERNLVWHSTGIIYSLDTAYTFTDLEVYGRRGRIEWAGSDTLVYGIAAYDRIFGSNLDNTTSVSENTTYINNFQLFQNYPNPFNPTTTINYAIPQDGTVTLKIYNALGAEVMTLVNETQSKGRYKVTFDASRLSNGIYLYRIQSGNFFSSKKMILLK